MNVSTLDAARQRLSDALALWQALTAARQYDDDFGASEDADEPSRKGSGLLSRAGPVRKSPDFHPRIQLILLVTVSHPVLLDGGEALTSIQGPQHSFKRGSFFPGQPGIAHQGFQCVFISRGGRGRRPIFHLNHLYSVEGRFDAEGLQRQKKLSGISHSLALRESRALSFIVKFPDPNICQIRPDAMT